MSIFNDNYDTCLCKGISSTGEECGKKEICLRYWSNMTAKQADKLGFRYDSFIIPDDVEDCKYFYNDISTK